MGNCGDQECCECIRATKVDVVDKSPTLQLEVLMQLRTATPDGKVISDAIRDKLVERALVAHAHGWNIITIDGLRLLEIIGMVKR